MRGSELVESLRRKFRVSTDAQLAAVLGISTVALRGWTRRQNMTSRQVADAIHRARVGVISGEKLEVALTRKLRTKTREDLASALGMTTVALWQWRKESRISIRQIANVVASAKGSSTAELASNAIRPLVEFFPVNKVPSRGRAKHEVFGREASGRSHPYRSGLHRELDEHHGVYIFFDSRGRAIYAGKARKLSLWTEMNNAFNRSRGVQSIKRVNHPDRKQRFKTSYEKARQIVAASVPLHELAGYFSAYQVRDELIDELESLLVRSFANDLSNVRMERFGQQRRASRNGRKKQKKKKK